MPTYTWNGTQTLRRGDGDDVEPGEQFSADEDSPIVDGFGDLVEEVAVAGPGTPAAEAADEQAAGDTDGGGDDVDELLDGTVADVEDELATGDYDDRLDEIENRADRQGVQDAVDERRE